MWLSSIAGLALSLAACTAIESRTLPASSPGIRISSGRAIHVGTLLVLYATLLALLQRPLCTAAVTMAMMALLVVVSNAKYRALREPFVFTDFGLFSQALRFPRLYLPFLDAVPTLAGITLFGAIGYAGFRLESPLARGTGMLQSVVAVVTMLLAGASLLRLGARASSQITCDPSTDLRRHGLLGSLWLQWRDERVAVPAVNSPYRPEFLVPTSRRAASLPDLVVIQSESFFDARRLMPGIRRELLSAFDQLALTGSVGRLSVPAWGANTMRSEFAFLTGIAAESLGVHRFNPYRHFARRPQPSLPWWLRELGYRTVCIHPHPREFFGRDKVFPALGFTDFTDIREFDRRETFGPYVSDAAVTRKIADTLSAADGPQLLFVITMENHGPLHLESTTSAEIAELFEGPPPAGFDDLWVYLRHLRNADRMLNDLVAILSSRERESVLCFFGDHVPSMPDVYSALNHDDGRTDFLLWSPKPLAPASRDLAVESLGLHLLQVAGLIEGPDTHARSR
ncbi:MAG: LTA synthase family protein [Methylotetracoccus sp.]